MNSELFKTKMVPQPTFIVHAENPKSLQKISYRPRELDKLEFIKKYSSFVIYSFPLMFCLLPEFI